MRALLWIGVVVGASRWILAGGCSSDDTSSSAGAGATSPSGSSASGPAGSGAGGNGQGASGGGGAGQGGAGGGQGGAGAGPCEQLCTNDTPPNQGCQNCIGNACDMELAACSNDVGGTGGAGGAGGGNGGCLSCAAVLNGGDPVGICPGSAPILDAFRLCVCGDDMTPGACG